MSNIMQQANAVLNAQERGFIEGVIQTTELYLNRTNAQLEANNLSWAKTELKALVAINLKELKVSQEDIDHWIAEYFG